MLLVSQTTTAKVYSSKQSFVEQIINLSNKAIEFENKTLWLDKNIQTQIKNILDHPYAKLRLHYKISSEPVGPISIWFLDEIGKERPISFAIAVKDNQIIQIRVLEFRESRGYEIHMLAFTQQFNQASVDENGYLEQSIDGITGATMSVNAMKKISRVALLLHKTILQQSD